MKVNQITLKSSIGFLLSPSPDKKKISTGCVWEESGLSDVSGGGHGQRSTADCTDLAKVRHDRSALVWDWPLQSKLFMLE